MQDHIDELQNIKKQLEEQIRKTQNRPDVPEAEKKEQAGMEYELQAVLNRIREEEAEKNASFTSMIDNVTPLEHDSILLKTPGITKEQAQARRRSAEKEIYREKLALSLEKVVYLEPASVTGFKKPGVQHGVFLKVKNGEYSIRDYIDLHNKTLDQARLAVDQFLSGSYERGYRFVIIIHGKGEFTKPQALLKSFVFHWLKQAEPVLAFHHAMPYHGGPGAVYVLLKKNDQLRQNTRERNS